MERERLIKELAEILNNDDAKLSEDEKKDNSRRIQQVNERLSHI